MIASTPSTAAPATAPSADEAKAKREADKLRQAARALETLKLTTERTRAGRKAAARKKIDALKEQLRQMQMIGASPRQIAQLARELAQAVKAYAAAGGKDGGAPMATPASPATATAAKAPATAAPGDQTGVEPVSEADAATEAPLEGSDSSEPETPSKPDGAEDPKTFYQKAMRALEEDAARQARRSAAVEEDRKFLADARQLAKELKAAAREAARKAREGDPAVREANKAVETAQQAVTDAEQAMRDTGGGAAGLAGLSLSV